MLLVGQEADDVSRRDGAPRPFRRPLPWPHCTDLPRKLAVGVTFPRTPSESPVAVSCDALHIQAKEALHQSSVKNAPRTEAPGGMRDADGRRGGRHAVRRSRARSGRQVRRRRPLFVRLCSASGSVPRRRRKAGLGKADMLAIGRAGRRAGAWH